MKYKYLLFFVTMFLGRASPGAAQVPAPARVEVAGNVAQIATIARSVSAAAPVKFMLRYRDSRQSAGHVNYLPGGEYELDASLDSMLPIATVKSLAFASSSLSLLKLLGGKVELNAFQSTLPLQYAQLGPTGNAGRDFRLPQQGYPGQARALHLSGISLNFHIGGNWRSESPMQTWRYLPRILSAVFN